MLLKSNFVDWKTIGVKLDRPETVSCFPYKSSESVFIFVSSFSIVPFVLFSPLFTLRVLNKHILSSCIPLLCHHRQLTFDPTLEVTC